MSKYLDSKQHKKVDYTTELCAKAQPEILRTTTVKTQHTLSQGELHIKNLLKISKDLTRPYENC